MSLRLQISPSKTQPKDLAKTNISLFVAGVGAIGGALLQQVKELNHPLFEVEVIGLCNSRFTNWNPDLAKLNGEVKLLNGEQTDWEEIPHQLIKKSSGNLIFVDATGSEVAARQYKKLLNSGVHVVTPSKRANTFGQLYFDELAGANAAGKAQYRYETAVGAGLPIISTLKTLIDSGDKITEISGVASGTMTYIFTQLQNGIPFSKVVRQAKDQGYSEPDPRDDLSGEDVARKFLILARASGFTFERDQIQVETLVPEELIQLSINEFLDKLPEYDDHWKSRNAQALVNNAKLRYVGTFTPDGIKVGIQEVPADAPLGGLKGTDNLLQFYTKRYSESPIVIQGPGAGRGVTAAGVLGDVIDVGRRG
ncbi:MAG: hypothetical protein WD059_11925 [Balneolaceae bacterium]